MNRQRIKLAAALIVIIAAIAYLDSTGSVNTGSLTPEKGMYPQAPGLSGATGYINTNSSISMAELKGKVVLVDFWTYTCINCIRTLPHLVEWDRKYRSAGLVIVGVHTPEFDFEKNYTNVKAAVEKYGIKYPVLLDSNYAIWNAYSNRYWPNKFLIDANGYVRYNHIGEGGYSETETEIQKLLAENGHATEGMTNVTDMTPTHSTTPELYAGYQFAIPRGQNIGNDGGLRTGATFNYTLPGKISANEIYLGGPWTSSPGSLDSRGVSSVVLAYTASSVNFVGGSYPASIMEVLLDGKYLTNGTAGSDVWFSGGKSYINVSSPRLYNAVSGAYGTHVLTLKVSSDSFSLNSFTFG